MVARRRRQGRSRAKRHEPQSQPSGRRRSIAFWIWGVLALGAALAIALHLSEAERLLDLVLHVRPAWLAIGIALQVGTYVCLAGGWRFVLVREGEPRSLASLASLAIAKLFTDQAVPSGGLSGTMLVVRGLERRGVALGLATGAVLVELLGSYVAFALCVALSLATLGAHGYLTAVVLVLAGAFAVIAAAIPAGILLLTGRARVPSWIARVPGLRTVVNALEQAPRALIHDGHLIAAGAVLEVGVIGLDALTLEAMLAAVGQPIAMPHVFSAFVIALVAETIGITPGGLGTFEAACVAMLHVWGVDFEAAVAATLLLRGLTFWLPMLPGVALARRELHA